MDSFWNLSYMENVSVPKHFYTDDTELDKIDYQAHSSEHRIISSFGITFLILVSLLGNGLVCLAVYQIKNLQSNVNYFVVSLAISDMLVGLISMPIWMTFELTKFEDLPLSIAPESLIKGWTFIDILSGVGSISNLVAISFERYWSIKSPLSHRICMTNTYIVVNVFAVWTFSFSVASLYIGLWQLKWKVLLVTIIGFLLPLSLILFSYLNVILILRKIPTNVISRQENHTVTRTLCILVTAFVICWLPFFIVSITSIHCKSCNVYVLKRQWIRSFVIWLHYLNSCCNPFLYCIFNAYYKDAFKMVLKKIFFRKHRTIVGRVRTQSRPISHCTRSTADRCSTIHMSFLERDRYQDEQGNGCCAVDMPLKNSIDCESTAFEPRYAPFDPKEYKAIRLTPGGLSRSESTEI
ncbi:D(2) dopamine receptor A-like isoform X1 [Rhopilema esculentum]|uniref:D(2) dopamine receptor A-like isoform X1 n=1 Tax=Rhopilema esculentum TaxID=499914 RepID=UPI0031E42BD0|eukprot:gene12548-3243_t